MGSRAVGDGGERLDHRSRAAWCDVSRDEGVRISQRQQPNLDSDAARDQQITELEDRCLAHVGRHEIRQFRPGGHQFLSALRVWLDGLRRA
jgi:hypothetical protein